MSTLGTSVHETNTHINIRNNNTSTSGGQLLLDFSQNAVDSRIESSQQSVSPPRYSQAIMGHNARAKAFVVSQNRTRHLAVSKNNATISKHIVK